MVYDIALPSSNKHAGSFPKEVVAVAFLPGIFQMMFQRE